MDGTVGNGAGSKPPVVVIGGGPVGLLTALDLSRHGVQSIVIERDDEIAWTSRAICISRRSMEMLDRAGAGEAFRRKALGWTRGQTYYRDELVFELDMPSPAWARHTPFVNLQQCFTEQFLLDALVATGHAAIRWGTRVSALQQTADGVRLEVTDGQTSGVLDASWVVAADGGRSTCRDLLGLKLKGTSYEGRYLIVDIEIDRDRPVERQVWFDSPSNPGSTVILHVQPDRFWRLDFQLLDGEDPDTALNDDSLRARIADHLTMMGETASWRLHWKSIYRAHCLTLDDYRYGRVVFAGDAAHLVPIFGVRGLNSGLDDAHNLGWKLALVAQGHAGPALLDSYTQERLAAAQENIAQGTKSTWFMSPPSAGFALMRDAVLSLAGRHSSLRPLINPRQATPLAYSASPLITADADMAGVPAGNPLPNLPAPSLARPDAYLHDLLAPAGFTVLAYLPSLPEAHIAVLRDWCRNAAAPVSVVGFGEDPTSVAGPLDDALAPRRWPVILVRPDEYVAARFPAVDLGALDRALMRAAGRGIAIMEQAA